MVPVSPGEFLGICGLGVLLFSGRWEGSMTSGVRCRGTGSIPNGYRGGVIAEVWRGESPEPKKIESACWEDGVVARDRDREGEEI